MHIGDICTREVVVADRASSMLVTSDGGQLCGLVPVDDLLGALGHEVAELAHALRKGIDRESAERKPIAGAAPLPPLRVPAYSYS